MAYQQLFISNISQIDINYFEDFLFNIGALSITLLDGEDQPILEPNPGETPLWDNLKAQVLFDVDINIDLISNQLLDHFTDLKPNLKLDLKLNLSWQKLEDQPWERAWLKYFKPMDFGKYLSIYPKSEPIEKEKEKLNLNKNKLNKKIIYLDPGLAFGTGTHPTTAMCLNGLSDSIYENFRLNKIYKNNKINILDYGCGSGILAIAAHSLFKDKINLLDAVDIDPQALTATRQNALDNGIALDLLKTYLPDDFKIKNQNKDQNKYDIVMANILQGPLIQLASVLSQYLKPNGVIILSGLLKSQSDEVIEAYLKFNIKLNIYQEIDGWVALINN